MSDVDADYLTKLSAHLKAAREAKGWTQTHLAQLLDISKQTVSQWEMGRGPPTVGNLLRFAALTGVAPGDFFNAISNKLSAHPDIRGRVKAAGRVVPLYEWVQLARALDDPSNIVITDFAASNFTHSTAAFAVKVEDRAMLPSYAVGDIIIVDPEMVPEPGTMVLACVDARYLLRRYRPRSSMKNDADLLALNPDWPAINLEFGGRVVGVATEHCRKGPLVT